MKWNKKKKSNPTVPTTAMPDIVFMLIFFFMVSSVLRTADGLQVSLPEARKIQKLESRVHVAYIWIAKSGMVSIDGRLVQIPSIRNIMYQKVVADPQLIVSIRADQKVNMEILNKIHKELRESTAVKVNYSTKSAA